MGPSGFEPESKRPKRPSIGQANPRAPTTLRPAYLSRTYLFKPLPFRCGITH